MGEPGTSESGSGGATSGASSSSQSSSQGGGGGGGKCPLTAVDLDPAIVATMTADQLEKFIETGRTGRRNALHDVSEAGVITTSTAGVAEALENLNVGDTSRDKSPEGAEGGS